ncbi:hypothetical protein DICPUDRAFT_48894 [Dictyostelium purpureum]|uniref:Acyl-coenzyme A oxidase n=1 Tax=Dictyostelium purpureum TaxID=5786 RepID=F0ZRB8_DICPU|nr:uncharacterized protein DICPUDRAFT_48894 [Dictyostelium purpureum]EGC33499.1 hypothetical protein DICPUDRAFT_48894 [Dictyostelium purpureum]|eukprot:XP_003289973.1 hypothetical protein DICPUDRAFT_48894 [Dictyostelium purpureum]
MDIKYTINAEEIFKARNSSLYKYGKDFAEIQDVIKKIGSKPVIDMVSDEHKALTDRDAKEIAKLGLISVELIRDDPKKFLAYLNSLVVIDLSVLAKLVIHYQLFGGTILELGTEQHHKKYFPDIKHMKIVGGFGMTEMGHGSNVRNIETIAEYDHQSKEFVINSPTPSSTKFWIGNLAKYGTHCVLFCKLIYKGEDKGVHGIVTPIRDVDTKQVFPGIEIGDCGPKIGWNGIDNAWIRFRNYRVPKENLLNKFANIDDKGEYTCKLPTPGKLFQNTISQLVFGRMLYICGPVRVLNINLKTVINYALSRRQFGEKGKSEELIMNYPSHYQVLLPMLGHLVAFEIARDSVIERLFDKNEEKLDETNSIISGVKALVNEYNMTCTNKLRTFCGGNGISSYNLFGYFRNEMDIFQTAEGDGAVLYQQLSKFLLSEYKKWYKKEGVTGYIIKEVQTFLATSNPIYTHSRSIPYILSNEFHHHAFSYRFEKMRSIVIEKLSHSKSKKMTFMQSWNDTLLYIIELSKAYTHLYILEQAHLSIKRCTDPPTRQLLNDLIKLYALSSIENDFGFYRNYNCISAGQALKISEAIKELCIAIKPYALDIINTDNSTSFDIPLAKDGNYIQHMASRVGIPFSKL